MTLAITPSDFCSLYSPSKCELRLYLKQTEIEPAPPGAFEQVILRLGQRHEKNHLLTFPEFTYLTGKPAERTLEDIWKGSCNSMMRMIQIYPSFTFSVYRQGKEASRLLLMSSILWM